MTGVRWVGVLLILAAAGTVWSLVTYDLGTRSRNTGYPDSGPLGWLASILFVLGLAALIGGGKDEANSGG
jgi:hypothetical protein